MLVALCLLLAACMSSPEHWAARYQRCGAVGPPGTLTTDWLPARAYIDVAEDQRQRGCYPVTLVGVQGPAAMLYRSAFKPRPDNIAKWHYEIGIGTAQAREMDKALSRQGYTIIWSDTSINASGAMLMQIVWTKAITGTGP